MIKRIRSLGPAAPRTYAQDDFGVVEGKKALVKRLSDLLEPDLTAPAIVSPSLSVADKTSVPAEAQQGGT